MKRLILLVLLPVLAACSSPRDNCLKSATRDLAVVDGLIAQTQANLSRGYGVVREPYTSTRVDVCVGGSRYGYGRGYRGVGMSYCAVPQTRYRSKPVTIDRQAEQRKLNELRQTRAKLLPQTQQRVKQCNAQFPAG